MRLLSPALLFGTCLLTVACTSSTPPEKTDSSKQLEERIDAQQAEIDSLKALATAPKPSPVPKPTPESNSSPEGKAYAIREGRHNLTLQWISWDQPGRATIKKVGEGRYQIDGEQRKGDDYLKIHGTLYPITDKELKFDGQLVYRVAFNNNGKPCDKSGTHKFLATKGRKYWRMQDMINCEGGLVTDYVDIYF